MSEQKMLNRIKKMDLLKEFTIIDFWESEIPEGTLFGLNCSGGFSLWYEEEEKDFYISTANKSYKLILKDK